MYWKTHTFKVKCYKHSYKSRRPGDGATLDSVIKSPCSPPVLTSFRMFYLTDAAIRGGSLIVVFWESERPYSWPRGRLAAWGL